MAEREPVPSWADWCDRSDALGLRMDSGELVGPCPSCGGDDRFHIRRRGPDALVGCRGCIDGGGTGFGAVLRAAFPERSERVRRPERPVGAISRSRTHGRKVRTASDPTPDPADIAPDPRAALVAQLWARSVPADATPGRLYLALRLAWPPHGIGPELPAAVRWLDANTAPGKAPAAKWYGLPDGAAGALAFVWRDTHTEDPDPRAVSMEAIGAAGERIEPRWRRTFGTRAGAVFEARAPRGGDSPVHVAEGEADALALVLAPWRGPGGVYAAGGTPGLRTDPERFAQLGSGPVVIHADEGGQGCKAAGEAQARIQSAGRECRVEWYAGDPADALAEWIGARAAIREYEGGEAREAADRGAWHDLLSEGSPDGP